MKSQLIVRFTETQDDLDFFIENGNSTQGRVKLVPKTTIRLDCKTFIEIGEVK